MRSPPVDFLKRPKVRTLKSWEGEPEAVMVRFRGPSIKGTRSLDLNRDVLHDFIVDSQDRPVCLVLMEPVSARELVKMVKGILQMSRRWKGLSRAEIQEVVSLVLRGLFLGLERRIPVPRPRAVPATASA